MRHHVLFSVVTKLNLPGRAAYRLMALPNLPVLRPRGTRGTENLCGRREHFVYKPRRSDPAWPRHDHRLACSRTPGFGVHGQYSGRSLLPGAGRGRGSYPGPILCRAAPTVRAEQVLARTTATDATVHAHVGVTFSDPRSSKYASILTDPMGRATRYHAMIERPYGAGRMMPATSPLEVEASIDQRGVFSRVVRHLMGRQPEVRCRGRQLPYRSRPCLTARSWS